ncbi:unnamed protein product [Euphydryas editha]|uniref:C2H2-type domain-containing protein n=1 Tax=Euphydryas editha TaxID=104508 RepID=A0AAU9T8F8_EUPED|nr:unnamed protein product [Euphydryas editha]
MEDLCTACLCSGRYLFNIEETELQQLYIQILNEISISEGMMSICVRVCWECKALLCRLLKFKRQTQQCYRDLLNYITSDVKPVIERSPKLQTQTVHSSSYPDLEVKLEFDSLDIKDELTDGETHYEPETFVYDLVVDDIKSKKEKKTTKKKSKQKVKLKKKKLEVKSVSKVSDMETECLESEITTKKWSDSETNDKCKCDECGATFDDQAVLKQHVEVEHTVTVQEESSATLNDKPATLLVAKQLSTTFSKEQSSTSAQEDNHSQSFKNLSSPATTSEQSISSTIKNKKSACLFCDHVEKRVGKRRTYVSFPKSDATVEAIKALAEKSNDLKILAKLEGPQFVAYLSYCLSSYRISLKRKCEPDPEPRYWHKNRQFHRLAFDAISEVIKAEIIEKNRVMYLSDLFYHYKSLLLEFAEGQAARAHSRDPEPRARGAAPERPQCVECGKVFSSRKTYRYHLNVLHKGQNRYPCPRCGKVYQWKSNLGRHMRSHKARDSGELHCLACDKRFASVATYRQHLRVSRRHVAETDFTFMCNECGKKFVNKTRLRDHIDWEHLNKIKFRCQLCNKPFKCHTSLYVHMQNVHRNKEKKDNLCHVCGKSYQNAAKLKYHIVAMHTSETPYSCEQCSAAFGWYSSLYRHVREVHYKMKIQPKKGKKPKKVPEVPAAAGC